MVFFFKALGNKPGELKLPSLVGMTVDEAQKKVPQVRILIERKEESPEFDTNVIIEQKPVENTKVKINSEVYVVVSSGLQSYTIPDFSGDTAAKAKKTLEDVGLDVETVNRTDSSVPAGTVIMTDPPADSEVKKGDKVILYVSLGEPDMPVTVPELSGKTEVEAKSELLKVGLSAGKVEAVDSNEEKGLVVGQSVLGGTKVEKGSIIDLKISNGNPVSSGVSINITFPSGADDRTFVFDVYVNGEFLESQSITPHTLSLIHI